MDPQNLAYALVQVAHNFGAAAVIGGAAGAFFLLRGGTESPRRLAWLVVAGWALQAVSGAGFGAVSYAWYGRFPDLHGIAVIALAIKMLCVAAGFTVAVVYLRLAGGWSAAGRRAAWGGLLVLAAIALSAAAFLRWFS